MTNYPEVWELKTIVYLGWWIMWVSRRRRTGFSLLFLLRPELGRLMTASDSMLVR